MAKIIDRRAGSAERTKFDEEHAAAANRRLEKGTRTFADFFQEDKLEKALTRRDILNILSMMEWARYEGQGWRRVWRWLRRLPQPALSPRNLAKAHGRQLAAIQERLEAERGEQVIAIAKDAEK